MAIAVNHLTSGEDGDGGNTSTASITPTANALVLVAISSGDTGAATAPSGLVGCNLTWVKIADVNEDEVGTGDINMSLWRGQGASPTTDTIDITWADAPQNALWTVVEYTGVPIGNDGADAIEQFVTEGTFSSETNNVAAFSVAPANTSAIFAAFGKNSTSAVATVGNGYTQIGTNNNDGSPSNQIWCQHALPSEATGLAIDGSSPAGVTAADAANTITTASFTPPAGSRLYAFAGFNRNGTGATVTFSSSPALTWTTLENESAAAFNVAAIGYADVAVSQSYTVTGTAAGGTSASDGRAMLVQVITGGEDSPPRGATHSEGDTGINVDIAVTSTRDDSLIIAVFNDSNGNADWNPGSGETDLLDFHDVFGDTVVWRLDGLAAIGTHTLNQDNGSSGSADGDLCIVEIRRAFEPADNTVTLHWDNASATTLVAVEILEQTAVQHEGAAALSGTGALDATAQLTAEAAAAITGAGDLTATAQQTFQVAAALAGAGALSAAAHFIWQGAAALDGAGALTATAHFIWDGAAVLSGSGDLSATAGIVYVAAATLSGAGDLTATGQSAVRLSNTLTNPSGTAVEGAKVTVTVKPAGAAPITGVVGEVEAVTYSDASGDWTVQLVANEHMDVEGSSYIVTQRLPDGTEQTWKATLTENTDQNLRDASGN